jgi:hypothetical protein
MNKTTSRTWVTQVTTWSFADADAQHFYVSVACPGAKFRVSQVLDAEGVRVNSTPKHVLKAGQSTDKFESFEVANSAAEAVFNLVASEIDTFSPAVEPIDPCDADIQRVTGGVFVYRSEIGWRASFELATDRETESPRPSALTAPSRANRATAKIPLSEPVRSTASAIKTSPVKPVKAQPMPAPENLTRSEISRRLMARVDASIVRRPGRRPCIELTGPGASAFFTFMLRKLLPGWKIVPGDSTSFVAVFPDGVVESTSRSDSYVFTKEALRALRSAGKEPALVNTD